MSTNNSYKIKNLVLSGGAIKGCSFIGSYAALYELNLVDQLKAIAGNSIGSLMAMCIALKYDADELYSFITSFDYNKVKQWDFINYFQSWGIEQGGKMESFSRALARNKLGKDDPTFEDLYQYNPIELTMVVTKLNTYETIYYNYQNTPKASLARTIRKSFAVPLLISPVIEEEIVNLKSEKIVYVDGAIRDNFPIQLYPDDETTVGILLEQCQHNFRSIDHLEQLIWQTFSCMFSVQSQEKIKKLKKTQIIHINCSTIDENSINLSIDFEGRKALYKLGYDITKKHFSDFFAELDKNEILKEKIGGELREKIGKDLKEKMEEFITLTKHSSQIDDLELKELLKKLLEKFDNIKNKTD